MTPTPEPAVGQVWMLPDGQVIHILELDAFGFAVVGSAYHHHYLACALRIPVAPDVVRLGWEYLGTLDELRELPALRKAKNTAYRFRNLLAAALAAHYPAVVYETTDEGWQKEWATCLYIQLPTGQVSFHFHESERHLVAHVPMAEANPWDKSGLDEHVERIEGLIATSGVYRTAAQHAEQVRTDNSAVIANLEGKVHQLEAALNRILVTNATWRGTPDFADAMSSALRKAGAALGDTKAGEDEAKAELALRAENAKLRAALKELLTKADALEDQLDNNSTWAVIEFWSAWTKAEEALTPTPHE